MEFGIAIESDSEAERNTRAVCDFSNRLKESLHQDYGADLQHFSVGLICMRSVPGYEEWYKTRKPRFRSRETVKLLDGSSEELVNTFGYDIKLTDEEYEQFVSSSPREAAAQVSELLIRSLVHLDDLPSKVQDFDRTRFEADVAHFADKALV
jgi:hypothetical protein